MGNILKKHIAQSGARKGQWVNCNAKQQCTLQNTTHITEQQLFATSAWLRSTGNKKTLKTITAEDVASYFKLDDANSREWNEKARVLALKVKGIPDPHGKENPFVDELRGQSAGSYVSQLERERALAILAEQARSKWTASQKREQRQLAEQDKEKRRQEAIRNTRLHPNRITVSPNDTQKSTQVIRGETVFSEAEFEAIKIQALKTGGEFSYDTAEVLSYPNDTPSMVKVTNLRFSGNKQYFGYVQSKHEEATDAIRYSRAITVNMREKDYREFLEDAKKISNVKIYVQKEEVTKGFFRSTVKATFDVRSSSSEGSKRIYDFVQNNKVMTELSSVKDSFTQPNKTVAYKDKINDPETQEAIKKVYQKIYEVETTYDGGEPLNMSDAHYLASAQSKYIPEAVEMYTKFDSIKDPEVKKQAQQLFTQQLDIITTKIGNIGRQREEAALNQLRGHKAFLEDRSDALAS